MADYHPPGVTAYMTGEDDDALECGRCVHFGEPVGSLPCRICHDMSHYEEMTVDHLEPVMEGD